MTEKTRDLIRANRLRQTFPTKMTNIEKALKEEFDRRGIRYEMHETFAGKWQPDFTIEDCRLFVQADGDYWHSLPHAIKNDKAFNARAKRDGWHVMRFWGREIEHDVHRCVDEVQALIMQCDHRG